MTSLCNTYKKSMAYMGECKSQKKNEQRKKDFKEEMEKIKGIPTIEFENLEPNEARENIKPRKL